MFLVYLAARLITNMVTVMMTNASNSTPWYAVSYTHLTLPTIYSV